MSDYQDKWIKGRVLSHGERECEARWEIVRSVLERYQRPFTLLDLGAAQGYFTFRAAAEFDCVAVAIEQRPGLADLAAANDLDNVIVLEHKLSLEDLERLAECESVDVVLALNVLHHFPAGEALRLFNAAASLGDVLIFETPPAGDSGACGQDAIPALAQLAESGKALGSVRRHTSKLDSTIRLYHQEGHRLSRAYFDAPDSEPFTPLEVDSDTAQRSVHFPAKDETRDWLAGINLRTYQLLGGVYPSREAVTEMVALTELPDQHGDVRPWNFILDGAQVHLIDGNDDKAVYEDEESLRACVEDVALPLTVGEWAELGRKLKLATSVAIVTPFRNARARVEQYFQQVANLRTYLDGEFRFRLIAAEGDSRDGTRDAIQTLALNHRIDLQLVPTDHGGPAWGSVEDPERLRTMSRVMNAALGAVKASDDLVLWIMSDLEWDPPTIAALLRAAEERMCGFDIFAPLVFQNGDFYDVWAYRKDGERFGTKPPYHKALSTGLTEVDSAGTCLAMRSEVARTARASDLEAVSFCADARASGYRVAVAPFLRLEHGAGERRRLLFVGDGVAATGFARCTHEAIPQLIEAGWDVDLVALNYYGTPHPYPYRIWPANVMGKFPMGELRMQRLLRTEDIDLVVLLNDPWNVAGFFEALAELPEERRPPVLAWLAVDGENQRSDGLEGLAHVVTWTEFASEQLRIAGYDGPLSVVPLGVNHDVFYPRDRAEARAILCPPELPDDAWIIGCVGTNQIRKRLDLLLKAFGSWRESHGIENAYLYLHHGPYNGPGVDVANLTKHYGLAGRVIVSSAPSVSGVSEEQMALLYSCFDLHVTATAGEGWGLPTLEAMACGVPCVVPDASGIGEWTGDAAYKVPCSSTMPLAPLNDLAYTLGAVVDEAKLAAALHSLYSFPDLRERHRTRGLAKSQEYSWQRTAREFREVVEAAYEALGEAEQEGERAS